MTTFLEVSLLPDDHGLCQLRGKVSNGNFAGSGIAYFNISELSDFGVALESCYPMNLGSELKLENSHKGYSVNLKNSDTPYEQFSLCFYPEDNLGHLACRCEFVEEGNGVKVAFPVEYQAIEKFGKDLQDLAEGKIDKAILK